MLNSYHIVYFVVGIMAFFVHYLGSNFYNQRLKSKKVNPKVFDIAHKYLPDLSTNKLLRDVTNILVFAPFLFGGKVVQEHMSFFIMILLVRSIFNMTTILPKHKTCKDESYTFYNVIFGHCYDKVFSGHFSSSVLLSLILLKHGIVTNVWSHIAFNAVNAVMILLLRGHYTIDLLVAYFVTLVFYQNNIRLDIK